MKSFSFVLIGLAGVLLMVVSPVVHAAVLVGNLLLHLMVLGIQFAAARLPVRLPGKRKEPGSAAERFEPFVSIHVAAHNEPPELLRETLDRLAMLDWDHYEVLVIDNNTSDEALWRPVKEDCARLGPRFRFHHVEGLKGYKAGALNLVRRHMDPRAEYIFVVDADYVVERDALKKAVRYLTDDRVALVQFPQRYRNVGAGNLGVALDFEHFFAGYMAAANRLECVPCTGTLSLLRVEALRSVGGFAEGMVTEDAELGLRLNLAGWRTVYAPERAGAGLMPHDLADLKKQRWRWSFGNAQILRTNAVRIFLGHELSLRQKVGCLAHLTAWFNFNLIPAVSLLVLAAVEVAGRMTPLQIYLVPLAGFTLVTFFVLRFGTLYHSLRPEGYRWREIFRAFLAHAGLGWIFSLSWLKCLWNPAAPFVRTNKFLTRAGYSLGAGLVELTQGAALIVAAVVLMASDYVLGPVAGLLLGLARFAILDVAKQMRWTRASSVIPELESGIGLPAARRERYG